VAAGSAGTDAVNVNQLNGAVSGINNNISNLANNINQLSAELSDTKDLAKAAGSLGLAAAQIRYDDRPGKLSLGLGGGLYEGETAAIVGLGYTSIDQFWRANISGGVSRNSNAGGGAGVSFTLN